MTERYCRNCGNYPPRRGLATCKRCAPFGQANPRPYVARFAQALEVRLRANDHKSGLDDMRVDDAVQRAWDEMRELDRAAFGDRMDQVSTISTTPATLELTASEALDLCAFALATWLAAKRDFEERQKEICEEATRA